MDVQRPDGLRCRALARSRCPAAGHPRSGRRPSSGARRRPGGLSPSLRRHDGCSSCAAERRAAPCTTSMSWRPPSDGHWTILTGCRKGGVRRGLEAGDAQTPLRRLVDLFGQDHVAVELFDHGDPQDTRRNDALADLATADAVACGGDEQRALRLPRTRITRRGGRRCACCAQHGRARRLASRPTEEHTCEAAQRWRRASGAIPVRSRTVSSSPQHRPSRSAAHALHSRSRRCRTVTLR